MSNSSGTIILKKQPTESTESTDLTEWVRMLLEAEISMERIKPEIQSIQEKREKAREEIFKRVHSNGQIHTPYGKIHIQNIISSSGIPYAEILQWIRSLELPGTLLPTTTTITKTLNELLEESFQSHFSKTLETSQEGHRRLTFYSNRKKTRRKKQEIKNQRIV